jgi:paraquat-inducible protein A
MSSSKHVAVSLRECPDCGLFQHIPTLGRTSVARCPRCDAVLRRGRTNPSIRALALALTGLVLFVLATRLDFLNLEFHGRVQDTSLVSGPLQLEQDGLGALGAGAVGMGAVGLVVLITTIVAPLARLCLLVFVLLGLRLRRCPEGLYLAFRWYVRLAPWSMVEVFMLGVFVAYTKLIDVAQIQIGDAVYALAALMLAQIAADSALDRELVWAAIARRAPPAPPAVPPPPERAPARLVGCDCCRLVTAAARSCPRCGARLLRRKPGSLTRTAALTAGAAMLYIPANLFPVLTYIEFGRGQPNTILGGVTELARSGMWPLALLVFFASITVPVLKLVGLSYLLFTTWWGSPAHLTRRTIIYRVVDYIGRWSMIDVFMISILTALVRLSPLVSVTPGPGVIAFCSVVILTMLAAITFDPRLMWDAATREPARPRAARPPVGVPAQ